jgi:hypothetical protein
MYTTLLHSGGVFEPTRQSAETHLCCRSNEMSAQLERVHSRRLKLIRARARLLRMSLRLRRRARMLQIGMSRVCTILQMSCTHDNSLPC